jgi:hypothetical protein
MCSRCSELEAEVKAQTEKARWWTRAAGAAEGRARAAENEVHRLRGTDPNFGVQATREMFARLLEELPPNQRVSLTSDGALDAEQMAHEIRTGSETGRAFASDILRVSRDMLLRLGPQKVT